MSQGDYISYLKTSVRLKRPEKLPPVLNSNDYILFKQYSLENTIINTKISNSDLSMIGKQNVFGMQKNVDSCPIFIDCSGTNMRPNRVLNTENYPDVTFRFNKMHNMEINNRLNKLQYDGKRLTKENDAKKNCPCLPIVG